MLGLTGNTGELADIIERKKLISCMFKRPDGKRKGGKDTKIFRR